MNFFLRLFWGLLLSLCFLIGSGCETRLNLTMKKDVPPIDRSVISAKLKDRKFTKIIIIPSATTSRGVFEPGIMLFEREFLRLGVTVISPAITGRVFLNSADKPDGKQVVAACDLSDVERALIMENSTGAEAILQIGDFKWNFPQVMTRYFIGELKDESNFREVSYEEWYSWPGQKRHFISPVLIFVGRLLNVNTGETMASFDISMPANYTLPHDYRARYIYDPVKNRLTKSKLIAEYNFLYDDESWLQRAMEQTEAKVIAYVTAQIIASKTADESPRASAMNEATGSIPNKTPAAPAKIDTVVTPPETAAEKKLITSQNFASYSGHVASFKSENSAAKFVQKMKAKGLVAFYKKENIAKKGVFYRAYIGKYKTSLEARQALTKLKKAGIISYFQIRKTVTKDREIVGRKMESGARNGGLVQQQPTLNIGTFRAESGKSDSATAKKTDSDIKEPRTLMPDLTPMEHYKLGMENIAKGQYQGALTDLDKAINADDKFTAAYSKRCFAFYMVGNADAAIKDCTKAVILKPDFAEAYYNRGLANHAANKIESAIADYDKAIAIDGQYEAAYAQRGYMHYLSGQNKLAITDYTEAIEIRPDDSATYFNRALAYHNDSQIDKAISDLQKSCALKNEQACQIAKDISKKR